MLSQHQINIIIETMKPYNPKKIGIFGSFARGENTENSDIDILYNFDLSSNMTFSKLFEIQEELEKRLNKSVDLVPEKYLNPLIKDNILNDLKIIYG
jgi:predicted nucleotidyltransferase